MNSSNFGPLVVDFNVVVNVSYWKKIKTKILNMVLEVVLIFAVYITETAENSQVHFWELLQLSSIRW